MNWREYHEATKHSPESLRRSRHMLDWADMPDPFRHYEGAPVLDLPADSPSLVTPVFDVMRGVAKNVGLDGHTLISQLLFYSAAISASKLVATTGRRYALRVNPSSGNLHPIEIHFFTRGLTGWADGLYHYRPSSHMAEQRAAGALGPHNSITVVLTVIAWREAWKYGDRAYRYCLLDAGHAWQSVALAAAAMGLRSTVRFDFADDDLAKELELSDDEWPMMVLELSDGALTAAAAGEVIWSGGRPSAISDRRSECVLMDRIHASTKVLVSTRGVASSNRTEITGAVVELPLPAPSSREFGETVRGRRSALDFEGGEKTMTLPELTALLSSTRLPENEFIQLYLYVHRVTGLEPGVYRYWPEQAAFETMQIGDQRVMAAALSLRQDLAGNACVAFSMVADMDRAVARHGDRGYRHVHFEAGAIGQRLYLAAEALGLRATGIGAFFDDQVSEYLELAASQQVVYHFAIGYPVVDSRLDAGRSSGA